MAETKLEQLLAAGELHRAARGVSTQADLARAVGMTPRAFKECKRRILAAGRPFPSLDELRGLPPSAQDPPRSRWPSVEAFDADEAPLSVVPAGHFIKGASTLVGPDGEIKAQWVKTRAIERDRFDSIVEAMAEAAAPWRGLADPAQVNASTNEDLLCVYPMGDPHLGMYAWSRETGNDFDLEQAERALVGAVDHLVGLAPPARDGLIINLGDFFHADNSSNQTARSGHALDVDTRWAKVLTVGVKTMRRCIDRALEKHERVRVINEIGNHDDHSAIMLSIALAQFYEREPRVWIDTSPEPFHWHRFGRCLIGVTHGHDTKPADLPGVMATDRAADWGETIHRHWYTGHVHHDTLKEYPGCTVETFRTLAARDRWHHGKGYRAGRDMKVDVLHREHGRIARHTVGIHQLCAPAMPMTTTTDR